MQLPIVTDCLDWEGKRVFMRSGLNVPVENGIVANAFRLKKVTETINWLRAKGAKVLVVGHIGREPRETLKPVFEVLSTEIPMAWASDYFSEETNTQIGAMQNGGVLMFENVRSLSGETENDPDLGKRLASLADIYVNDAFPDSHRAHASIVGVPTHIPAYAGFQFAREVAELEKALSPQSPSLFILGGAKFETKFPILKVMLPLYDDVFVGGALANDLFRATGIEVGQSLVSENAEGVFELKDNPKILVPIDVVVQGENGGLVKTPDAVLPSDSILDCGPQTVSMLSEKIHLSKQVLWNGPLGNYEQGFSQSTEAIAKAVSKAGGISIVGGGDTVAAIEKLGLEQQFTFVSTGGGAMLDFLADATLPGIDAIVASPK